MPWAAFIEFSLFIILGGVVAWFILKPAPKKRDNRKK